MGTLAERAFQSGAAVNIGVHESFQIMFFSGYTSGSGIGWVIW